VNKDVKQLIRSIEHIEGVELRQTNSGHLAVYFRNKFITIIGTTPSDHRWRENTMTALRRAGITPANRPQGPTKEMQELLSIDTLKERVKALPNRAAFARFLVDEMPKLQPELRTYKNIASAESSLHEMKKESYGLRGWTHLLLDAAMREWDVRMLAVSAKNGGAKADEVLDEVVAAAEVVAEVELGPAVVELSEEPEPVEQVQPELAGVAFADLARQHEELSERIDKMAEHVRTRQAQLAELVASRDAVSEEILARLSKSEGVS
jgi:uncharacterized protein YdcH (DUF465 family)